ncbi:phosphotransferase [Oryzobacter terrae]|uniref:phosphotransferase n=1 Tax=Oryzobacter terrae TaxID=1620385 RepID=UPI003670A463
MPRSERPDEPREGLVARLLVLGTDAARVSATADLCRALGVADEVVEHRPDQPAGPDDGRGGPGGPVGLVVALGSAWPDVLAVLPALGPGGVLYWEADGRAGAWASLRRLRRVGMTATAYRRRRHGEHDTLFLPLGPREAARWYVDELADDSGTARRVARRLATSSGAAIRGALGAVGGPVSWVAVRGEGDLTPGVLVDLDLGGVPSGPGDAGPTLPVVLTRGEGEWSRVVLLPFDDRDRSPRAVVKLPRLARHGEATLRERRLLAELAQTLPEPVRASVPVPLGGGSWQGLPVAVESYLPGRPLGHRGRAEDDPGRAELLRAAAWVAALHRPTRPPSAVAPSLDATLDEAVASCGLVLGPEVRGRFGDAALRGTELPRGYQHGDLTPTNLRVAGGGVAGGGLSAVDWESGRAGAPLTDLLYLLLHWPWPGHPDLGTAPDDVLRAVFLRTDGTPARTAQAVVTAYLGQLDLPRHVVGPLLAHMLALQAVDRAGRVASSGDRPVGNLYADLLGSAVTAPEGSTWW